MGKNWSDYFESSFTPAFSNAQQMAYEQWKEKQSVDAEDAKNQIEMAKMGYTPSNISMGSFNKLSPGNPPPAGQYLKMGGNLYRQNPDLLKNLQALKPNLGSNIIVPSSLTTPESKNLKGNDVLDKLDPNTAEVVKGLADYSLDPSRVTSMRGNQRMQIAGLTKRVDPNFDMKLYPARADYMKNVYGGTIYNNATSLNTLAAHLDNLDQTIENAHMSGQPLANVFILKARELSGDPTITDLRTAKEVIDTEMQRALTNAAVTVEGLNAQRKLQRLDLSSYSQAKQYVKSIGHIAAQRGGQMEEAFVQRMGKPSNGLIINPSAQETYSRLAGNKDNNLPSEEDIQHTLKLHPEYTREKLLKKLGAQ